MKSISMDNNTKTHAPKIVVDKFYDFFSKIGTNLSKYMAETTPKTIVNFWKKIS